MSGTEEEVDGKPIDQIAKIAGPVGGLWVAYNEVGISGAAFANLTTFARFREEHHDRTGRGAAHTDSMPDDLFDAIEHSFNTGDRSGLTFDLRGGTPFQVAVWEACLA
ncbi:MAG: hypothetical protein VYA89_04695, partial [Actinomycetota bacterium]|nr:hypothetical protein [Actinomycetota bacterium]